MPFVIGLKKSRLSYNFKGGGTGPIFYSTEIKALPPGTFPDVSLYILNFFLIAPALAGLLFYPSVISKSKQRLLC